MLVLVFQRRQQALAESWLPFLKQLMTDDLVNKPGGFTAEDLRIAAILADQAAVAIQNARLHEQIEQLAAVAERSGWPTTCMTRWPSRSTA